MKKSFIAVLAISIAAHVVGMPSGQERSPIIYWIDSISYSQDLSEEGKSTDTTTTQSGKREDVKVINDEEYRKNKSVNMGGNVEIDTFFSGSAKSGSTKKSGWSAGGTVKARAHAGTELSWVTTCNERIQSKKEIYDSAERTAQNDVYYAKSEWKLRFNIKFKNMSTNQTFRYNKSDAQIKGTQNSGLILVIKDNLGGKIMYEIPVTVKALQQDSFDLKANGGEVTFPVVEAEILSEEHKKNLRTIQIRGEMDKCIAIKFDDNFHLVEEGSEKLWNHKDVNVSKISKIGSWSESENNFELPLVIDCRGLTYSNVLEKASSELPDEYKFTFSTNGSLDKVFGRSLGRFGKDDYGVFVILVKMHGMLYDNLSHTELSSKPSSLFDNNDICFGRIGLYDLYSNKTQCPDSVISNCLVYVENTSDIPEKDLFVCAMLAKEKGDYTLFGRFLSRMEKVDDFLKTDEDKALALRLIIQSDNIDYFKNLYSRLKWINKYDGKERTMLGYAAEMGSLNIVKWLLDEAPGHERPKVNELVPSENKKPTGDAGKTPLFWAAKNGHLEMCQYLVSKGAGFYRKFYELKNGETEEYDELVDKSYIPDDRCRKYIEAEREVFEVSDRFVAGFRDPHRATGEKIRAWVEAGVPPDRALGGDWYLLTWAVELQDDNLVEFLTSKESSNEVRELLLKAKEGDADAMNKLGTRYVKGNGVSPILKVAFYWFSKAAEHNHLNGLHNLAKCYNEGKGVKKDSDKAKELLEKRNKLLDELEQGVKQP